MAHTKLSIFLHLTSYGLGDGLGEKSAQRRSNISTRPIICGSERKVVMGRVVHTQQLGPTLLGESRKWGHGIGRHPKT